MFCSLFQRLDLYSICSKYFKYICVKLKTDPRSAYSWLVLYTFMPIWGSAEFLCYLLWWFYFVLFIQWLKLLSVVTLNRTSVEIPFKVPSNLSPSLFPSSGCLLWLFRSTLIFLFFFLDLVKFVKNQSALQSQSDPRAWWLTCKSVWMTSDTVATLNQTHTHTRTHINTHTHHCHGSR